jgi:pimeloyl-ACP methyl ester carboxylesterase
MNRRLALKLLLILLWLPGIGLAEGRKPATRPATHRYLLHLPGIGGHRSIDDSLVRGLQLGGVDGEFEIYDWTGDDMGLKALVSRPRHTEQSRLIAARIADRFAAGPQDTIDLSGHSGGAGLAVWALEQLPQDVMVETVLLLAPALSPDYDLTAALKHVRGRLYVISSEHDPVLVAGTRAFGTIDGVKTDSAGKVGFSRPSGGDPVQYRKLVPMPYDSDWARQGNFGDHIGPMMRPFAREVLAPLILGHAPSSGRESGVGNTKPAATQASP